MKSPDYIKINKNSWNRKTDIHINSEFYDNENFIKGQSSLNNIELELLGDIRGKSILHLQCHFGQDTISLSRLGGLATGVDFSDKAVDSAKELALKCDSNSKFICCNVYDLPNYLDEKFDIVFTSYGTIGWLPDMNSWAGIISNFLKPKGKLVFVEFHPVVWMFDDNFSEVKYNYFNSGPIVESIDGTYAEKDADLSQEYVMWNHGIGEVLTSLLEKELELQSFNEYDYSPYDCFNKTIKMGTKKFRIGHLDNKIPMVYAVVATKKE